MGQDPSPAWAERSFNRVPMIMSYVILGVTWVAFVVIVSIHSTLIKREEYLHFFIQQIVYNSLFGLTVMSLFCAMAINPGQPNPDLAPPGIGPSPEMQEIGHTNVERPLAHRRKERPTRLNTADPDDVPLRFLRNSQWVSSRIGKDRPSPLPLRFNQPTRSSARRESEGDNPESSAESGASFPLSANPLVPHSALQAGEDFDEREEDLDKVKNIEGDWNSLQIGASDDEAQLGGMTAQDPLLQPHEGRRSIMAKSNDGLPRWCRKCDAWKPDRTHHCRFCRRCTLKMDHHCIWLGTCVGFHNYKPFLLFISYSTLLAFYAMLEAGYESFRFFQDPDDFLSTASAQPTSLNGTCVGTTCAVSNFYTSNDEILDPSPIVSICIAIIGAVFTLAVGSLAGYHWWLACHNMTTLENMSYSYPSVLLESSPELSQGGNVRAVGWKPDHLLTRIERNRLQRDARSINVYDIGIKGNMRSIFGDRSKFLAGWPMIRAYRKRNIEAGHFFDVDDDKLERLKDLTRELRYGKKTSNTISDLNDSREASFEEDEEREGASSWDHQPRTGSSGERGDDEMTDVDLSTERSSQRRFVPWFER